MIKIYDLLFEQDATTTSTDSSSGSSTSSTSSSSTMDPTKLGDVVKKAVTDSIKEPLNSIQAWIKQSEKEKATRPTPSNAESTTSTMGTKATGPSKPAGVNTASSATSSQNLTSGQTQQPLSQKDIKSIAGEVSKNIKQENN